MTILTFALVLALVFITFVQAQGDDGKIKWSSLPGLEAATRECVKACLNVDVGAQPEDATIHLACGTPQCICSPDHFNVIIQYASECAVNKCHQDNGEALQNLIGFFCKSRGYAVTTSSVIGSTGTGTGVTIPTATPQSAAQLTGIPIGLYLASVAVWATL